MKNFLVVPAGIYFNDSGASIVILILSSNLVILPSNSLSASSKKSISKNSTTVPLVTEFLILLTKLASKSLSLTSLTSILASTVKPSSIAAINLAFVSASIDSLELSSNAFSITLETMMFITLTTASPSFLLGW